MPPQDLLYLPFQFLWKRKVSLFIFQNSLEQEILNPTLLTPDLCKFEVSSDLPVRLLVRLKLTNNQGEKKKLLVNQ